MPMTKFKTGDHVLIPGQVHGPAVYDGNSGDFVVVTTEFDNSIVERETDLLFRYPDNPPPESTERRIERIARVLCKSDSVDPESKASVGQPLLLATGFVITGTPFEAWRLYAKYARALVDKGLA